MLAIAFLGGAMWFGSSILRLCGVHLTREERLVAGPMLGLAAGSWTLYLTAASTGSLSVATLAAVLGLFVLAGLAATRRPAPPRAAIPGWFGNLAGAVVLALGIMNLYHVLARGPDGAVLAGEHIWADTPFHTSLITSFAYRDDFPPHYPLALGQPLGYPFLVDFLSGVLLRFGLPLRASVVVVNVVMHTGFYLAVALLAYRFTRSPRAAVLSAAALLCLGNLGFVTALRDMRIAGGFGRWLADVPWSYTGEAIGHPGCVKAGRCADPATGIYLGNPTFMYFLPRRSGAFGLAIGATVLLLLDELCRRRRAGLAIAAGIGLGLLPRIHAHTAMVLLVFAAVWFATLPLRRDAPAVREWRAAAPVWILCGAVALVVALPQMAAMREQSHGFFSWWAAWIGEPHTAWTTGGSAARALGVSVRFWVLNAGVLLLALYPALRASRRGMRVFYLPFAVVFLLANLVRTQPWEWDNSNYFVYWQMGTTIVVASWIAALLGSSKLQIRLAAGAVLAAMTLGGFLSFLFAAQHRLHLWTVEEAAFAADVRDRTPRDAVILTSNGHEHPVIALSGRQTFMGFTGWFVAHGLDWATYEDRLKRMYRGDVALMRRLGITHVVIGPWEEGMRVNDAQALSGETFDDQQTFRTVLDEDVRGRRWQLLELI